MKNAEKKIVSIIVSLLLFSCFVASVISFCLYGDFEKSTTSKHPFKDFFSSVYGQIKRFEGRSIILDGETEIYLLENNYLANKKEYIDTSIYKDKIAELKEFLDIQNIGFEYVITAEAGDERQGKLPKGVETNNCEKVTGELINTLNECNVNYIDTYKYLSNGEMDYYDYFYILIITTQDL